MTRTYITDLSAKIGQEVLIKGWVSVVRSQKEITFLVVRDITGTVQTVINEKYTKLSLESVVAITGLVEKNIQAPNGFEIKISNLEVLSATDPELPIPVMEKGDGETNQAKRLDWRWLDLRKPKNAKIFKVWTKMEHAFRQYCVSNGFIEIHSPKIVVTSTESGSELFEIKYFDQKAYLAQSPQLYKQMAMAAGFEKVFEVGPVFRANPSFTSRHDTEFTMYDIEMSFINSHHDLMAEEEKMMHFMFEAINLEYPVDIPVLPFPKLTLREAKEILKKLGVPSDRGEDMGSEEEKAIAKYIKDTFGHDFVFIYDYPSSVRAFYSMRHEDDPTLSKSFDLLYRGLEITSGAQREHRYDVLKKQILEKGFDEKPFENYLNFFKYGCPPHGGFAPGPSRLLMKVMGYNNVRDVTYLYRGVNRLTP